MPTQKISDAVTLISGSYTMFSEALDDLMKITGPSGEHFDFKLKLPGSDNLTATFVADRFAAVSEYVQKLKDGDVSLLLLDADVDELANRAAELRTAVTNLRSMVDQHSASLPVQGLNVTEYSSTDAAGNARTFWDPMVAINKRLQETLRSAQKVGASVLGTGVIEFSGVIADLASVRADLRNDVGTIAGQLAQLKKEISEIQTAKKQVDTSRAASKESLAETQKAKAEVDQVLAAARESKKATDEAINSAKALSTSVLEFDKKFKQFDDQLGQREQRLADGNLKFDHLQKDLTAVAGELDRIVGRSRAVLGEATISGLSDRFADERNKIEKRLKVAQALFFAGIILLLFTGGVLLDMFPWAAKLVKYQSRLAPDSSDWGPNLVYLFNSVVGRLIVLLPSILLIAFSAKWYAALFRLREVYAHKYAVAASLPGFKIEAPTYSEAITASGFKELLDNPAVDVAKNENGNSVFERLLAPYVKSTLEKMLKGLDGTPTQKP